MASVCLSPASAESFKKALDKDFTVADLLNMSTEDRTALFEKYGGKDAKTINTLFEEKIVLKNWKLGLKNYMDKLSQQGRWSPEKKAQMAQTLKEFEQLQEERIFNPTEMQSFLNDLADKQAGAHITREQANNLRELSVKSNEDFAKFKDGAWESPEARKAYGDSKYAYEHYADMLKAGDVTFKSAIREMLNEFKDTWKTNKPKAVTDLILKFVKGVTDASIATVASLDNSFLGRQGLLTLFTEPQRWLQAKKNGIPYKNIWWNGANKSFVDFYKTLKEENMKAVLMSDMYSNPNYINGAYDIAKLLPKNEEQYPTSLPERIPGLGKVFKASQAAFEGSAVRMRTQLYDFTSELAKKNGVDMTDKYQIQSIGRLVNSMTARGATGETGGGVIRLVLWAPKMLKAHWDVLTAHAGQDISPFARRQAAMNLMSFVATAGAIMTIANALQPGSAETDPRSSDFGKIKIGNTRFDFTGGAASLAVLASRIGTLSSKSSSTGVVKPLNSGEYGSQTGFDVLVDFLVGKTNPVVGSAIAVLKNADFKGQKPTVTGTLENVALPITIQNALNLKDDHSVSAVIGVLLDGLGVNASTYSPQKTDWTQAQGVELQTFKAKVGDAKFQEANKLYNTQVANMVSSLQTNEKYKALSQTDKQKVVTKKKTDIKTKILRQYGFRYKRKSAKTPKV